MTDHEEKISASEKILPLIRNWNLAPMLYVTAKLEIADHLSTAPMTPEQLASKTGAHAPSLYRLLRALATMGIFRENDAGEFELTPLSQLLRKDTADSMRLRVLWSCSPMFWKPWGELMHTIMTGETAFDHVFGKGLFEHLDADDEDAALFNTAMTRMTGAEGAAVAKAHDFSAYGSVMDVGGGHGSLMIAILQAHPDVQGAIFDLPKVIEGTGAALESGGVKDRCTLIGGSFFETIPSGYDAYILKDIIHDWDDEKSIAILRSCHNAMSGQGKLLLVERVIRPGNDMNAAKWIDLTMMLVTGGQERTEQEYRDLLRQGGFSLERIIPTEVEHNIITAKPV